MTGRCHFHGVSDERCCPAWAVATPVPFLRPAIDEAMRREVAVRLEIGRTEMELRVRAPWMNAQERRELAEKWVREDVPA